MAIEHVGSTAVLGLGAKPIIDIMTRVGGALDADEYVPLLMRIGYTDITIGGNPDWYYCLGKGVHSVGYHLHLVGHGSDFAETLFL